jgi:hypothetical protein
MDNAGKVLFWEKGENRANVLSAYELMKKQKGEFADTLELLANAVVKEVASGADIIEFKAIQCLR